MTMVLIALDPVFLAARAQRCGQVHVEAPRDAAHPVGASLEGVRLVHERLAFEEIARHRDRKSTRLNSSHMSKSYAVFCLKKKKKKDNKLYIHNKKKKKKKNKNED